MSSAKPKKRTGGSSCAVATCNRYASKAKELGLNISFHRFPKNITIQKQWIHKCKRCDKVNPSTAFVCSEHFTADSFVRDLKAELLGYIPKIRILKPDAVPTLNLPHDHSQNVVSSSSAISRRSRMEAKLAKQTHDQIIALSIEESLTNTSTSVSNKASTNLRDVSDTPAAYDYETLYKGLCKEYDILKTQNESNKKELLSLKQSYVNYESLNESLRFNLKIVQKNLRATNLMLQASKKKMSKEVQFLSKTKTKLIEVTAKKYLSTIFSPNQLDLIMKKKKKVHWSRDEISKAFTLRYFSKRAYMYVKNELHYPLPGLSSLQRWAKTIEIRNGVLHDILKLMSLNAQNMKSYEKLTVLMFDVIKVSSTNNYMLVVMARGIASPWKQPVMVDFDTKMTKSILNDIIEKLDIIGYNVVCCVCDCSSGNVELWKELEVSYKQPMMYTPKGNQIVCIPDAPHLLKLVRNWLLDTGFTFDNKVINKEPLEALVKMMTTEVNVCHKLSKEHLICEGPQHQKMKLATQLLSHTTATALKHYKPIENINLNNHTADFIELISNWFDLANISHTSNNQTPFKAPYGVFFEKQELLLNQVYERILYMRCNGKNNLQIFQEGMLMYINSIKLLLNILKKEGFNYLLTSKINLDALKDLFSQFQSSDELNDHPSLLNALNRIQMITLGKNPDVSSNSNTQDDNEEFLLAKIFKEVDIINENYDEDKTNETDSENES